MYYQVLQELKQITVAGISTNQNNISNTQFALYYFFIFVKIKHIAINERFIKEIRK
jgi:hypothetical protein